MDREMWILRQLETSLTASAEALAERLQVSPRTITNTINTLNRMLAPAASVRPTGGRYRLYILDPQEYSQIRGRLVRATNSSTTRVIAAHRSSESCCLPNTR